MDFVLKDYLNKLDLSHYGYGNRQGGTKTVSKAICEFAKEHHFDCQQEVFLGLKRSKNDYRGYVDFILKSEDCYFAIEVDSSNKKWSLEKLLHAKSLGYSPIWVRWCVKVKMEVPKSIYLIDLADDPTN